MREGRRCRIFCYLCQCLFPVELLAFKVEVNLALLEDVGLTILEPEELSSGQSIGTAWAAKTSHAALQM